MKAKGTDPPGAPRPGAARGDPAGAGFGPRMPASTAAGTGGAALLLGSVRQNTFPTLCTSTAPGQHNSSPADLEQKQPQISLMLDTCSTWEAVLIWDHVLESRLMKHWLKPKFLLYMPMHILCAVASKGCPPAHQDTSLVPLTSLPPQWFCTHKRPHP